MQREERARKIEDNSKSNHWTQLQPNTKTKLWPQPNWKMSYLWILRLCIFKMLKWPKLNKQQCTWRKEENEFTQLIFDDLGTNSHLALCRLLSLGFLALHCQINDSTGAVNSSFKDDESTFNLLCGSGESLMDTLLSWNHYNIDTSKRISATLYRHR